MYLLYSVTLFLSILFAAPYFLYQALAHKKYLGSLAARLGIAPVRLEPSDYRRLLIHCVSVGEFLAAEPLIERLRARLPNYRLVISTTTATGQALARERAAQFADICYFPIDFGFAARRMLDRIKPSAVVILETELWPNFLRAAAARRIPVFIANGRISDSSFRRYSLVRLLLRRVLADVTCFLMQSTRDGERICALGAPKERVFVCGNIKYDLGTSAQAARLDRLAAQLEAQLDLRGRRPLLVAGSTVPGEEALLLAAYRHLLAEPGLATTRLLLAPRRPERFDQVAGLLAAADLPFIRRSEQTSDNKGRGGVILLDSIGELAAVYRYADLVFVGGSLVPYGGHNILEPALYGRAIVTGPYTSNFRKIVEDFVAARAIVQLPLLENGEMGRRLAEEMIRLMKNDRLRSELGERARQVMEANRGALEQQTEKIASMVENED